MKSFEDLILLGSHILYKDCSDEEQTQGIRELLSSLPRENYHLVRQLCRLMYMISLSADSNLMTVANLITVIAPNMIWCPYELDSFASISSLERANNVITPIVAKYPEFFEQGSDLLEPDFLQDDPGLAIFYRKVVGHVKSITALEFTSGQDYLWTTDSKGMYRIWSVSTMELISGFDTNKKRINCITRCGENMWLGTGDCIQIRNERTGDLVAEIPDAPTHNICCFGNNVWVGGDGAMLCYNSETLEPTSIPVSALVLCTLVVENCIWSVCTDRKIRVWEALTMELLHEVDTSNLNRLNSLDYVNGNVWGAADGGNIIIWNPTTYEEVMVLSGHHSGKVFGTCQVGKDAWTFGWDGKINVYHAETFEFGGVVQSYHSDAISAISCIHDTANNCLKVFTASWDTSVGVWLVVEERTLKSSTEM